MSLETQTSDQLFQKLTEREIEVLKLVAMGWKNPEIAAALKISRRTVEAHRAKMRMRTQLNTQTLVKYALRAGIGEQAN